MEVINMWQSWVIAIVGLWVIIVPYLNMSESSLKMILVITGIVIIILGLWGAMGKKMMS